MENHSSAKERILQTVLNLLIEKKDISKLTNRQIAEMAEVNSALINYYYQSKENLFKVAVEACMGDIFKEIIEKSTGDGQPTMRLKRMIKEIADISFSNYALAGLALKYDMSNGSLSTTQMILPLLKEIYENSKTESELKVIGLQIIIPFQSLFINVDVYKNYLLCDFYNEKTRREFVDRMIDNIIRT